MWPQQSGGSLVMPSYIAEMFQTAQAIRFPGQPKLAGPATDDGDDNTTIHTNYALFTQDLPRGCARSGSRPTATSPGHITTTSTLSNQGQACDQQRSSTSYAAPDGVVGAHPVAVSRRSSLPRAAAA